MLSFIFSVLGYFFLFGAIAGLLQGEFLTGSLFIPVAITLLIKSKHANKALAKILQKKEIPTKSGWLHLGVAFLFLMIAGVTIPKDEIASTVSTEDKATTQKKTKAQQERSNPDEIADEQSTTNPAHEEVKELDLEDRTVEAIVLCKRYVKNSLTSPSSADFPWPDEFKRWKRKNQNYIVKSYVDSKNAYGVKMRSQWHCELQYTGKGKDDYDPSSWELKVLEII